ncbi:hypothetical protein [Frigidibacter oleivorans]|uniref:hypothetical protein n=1 Tax=Frigidibacter oleivorans TaxID=2487129 RepID=UPI000F8C783C|nr:hypothetical protein [Frigidibacter oleivorans]
MRRAAGIIGLVGTGVLSACAAPSGTGGAMAPAGPARVPVAVEGKAFLAEIAPGPAGIRLTAAGAVPVPGMGVTVRRSATPLGYDEGKVAKEAARLACEGQGRRFDGTVQGRFGQGAWQFAGACA